EVRLPTGPDQGQAARLQEAVALRVRSGGTDIVEARIELVAAIDDLEEHHVIALALVDRLEDLKLRRVLHHASGIARCELDVLDDAVSLVLRIDFAERDAGDELVGPDRAEGRAPIRRYSAGDGDLGDSCFGRRRRAEKQSTCAHEQERAQPVRPAK